MKALMPFPTKVKIISRNQVIPSEIGLAISN